MLQDRRDLWNIPQKKVKPIDDWRAKVSGGTFI